MIYRIKKVCRWLAIFGWSGFKALTLRTRAEHSLITLHSKRYGVLRCRLLVEDVEAVNTVMCFKAYKNADPRRRYGTVVDLGANIGIATRFFLAEYPEASIVAVEPDDRNCSIFQINVCVAGAENKVRLVRAAVGPSSGRGWLTNNASERLDSLRVEFTTTASESRENTIGSVEVVSLEDLMEGLKGPILLKIDIEGAETALLEMRARWQGVVARMMVEFHDANHEREWVRTLTGEGWTAEKHFDTWHFDRYC